MSKTNQERIRELQTALNNIEKQVKQVEEQINSSKIFIDEISQHKTHSEQWRGEIEAAKNQSEATLNEIRNIKNETDQTKEELHEKLNVVDVKKEEIDKFFIKIFGEENDKGERTGGLKERLAQKENEAKNFLATQEKKYSELFTKIESLLPAATSTGLAEAYYKQKESYKWPIRIWAFVFIIALIGVILTGIVSFEEAVDAKKAFYKLASRFPFYFALIWLAAFSSKQYRQNKRLEQEYAHKEVLAKSYQGYKNEFESKDKAKDNEEVLTSLKKTLIEAIAKNPSEILDDGTSEDTPSFWHKPLNILGKNKDE